jgi:hypothetical protein
MEIYDFNPSHSGCKGRKNSVLGQPRQNVRTYLKNNLKQNYTGGVIQVLLHLSSKRKALGSNPSKTLSYRSNESTFLS